MPRRADVVQLADIINALPADAQQRGPLQTQLQRETTDLLTVQPSAEHQRLQQQQQARDAAFQLDEQRLQQQQKRDRRWRIAGLSLAITLSVLAPLGLLFAALTADAPVTGGGLLVGGWVLAYLECCAWTKALEHDA